MFFITKKNVVENLENPEEHEEKNKSPIFVCGFEFYRSQGPGDLDVLGCVSGSGLGVREAMIL